jgi:hypothetical protein
VVTLASGDDAAHDQRVPTITIYVRDDSWVQRIERLLTSLAAEAAAQLSTPEMDIDADHISIRVMVTRASRMMSAVEVEISAHAFPSRVQRQDHICGALRVWLAEREIPARVWLQLSELGYGYATPPPGGAA